MKTNRVMDLSGKWKLHMYPDAESGQYEALLNSGQPFLSKHPGISGVQDFCGRIDTSDLICVDALVPGSYELDLERAGIIPDPYVGMNMPMLEKYEYYHLVYEKIFALDHEPTGYERLIFEGVDTFADVRINGTCIGSCDNMLVSHEFPAASLKKGENLLSVHIYPTVLRAREFGCTALSYALKYNYDSLNVRKSPSMFGWDICPRMVSGGLWRPVSLVEKADIGLVQAYLFAERIEQEKAVLQFFYEAELGKQEASRFRVEITGRCGSSRFFYSSRIWGKAGRDWIAVPNPQLWWPRGYGKQSLYDVSVRLLRDGEVVDEQSFRTGIRTVKLLRTSYVDENGEGEFCFEINGMRIFVLGTNWVPADAHPSLADLRADDVLKDVLDIGCNAIRVWGGGHYETDGFYSLCDEKGLIVWHDFIMACGNYPQTPEFCEKLRKEVVQVVRALRHHPSICLWAGDNECDTNYRFNINFTDPNDNIVTRRIIYDTLLAEDFCRPYLPSSPYYDEEYCKKGSVSSTEEHLWGDRKYYKAPFYKDAAALFASEMGYHGCPSPDSLRQFITPGEVSNYKGQEWLLHASCPDPDPGEPYAYRNELMASQIKTLFGEIPGDIERFALASQISQAEALQFFIQHFRSRKGRCSGIIWWNIRDCWPQISDAVMDYYGRRKLAYHYIKRCQQPVCLMIEERKEGMLSLYGVNDTGTECDLDYRIVNSRGICYSGRAVIPCDRAVLISDFPALDIKELWKICWEYDGRKGENSYLTGTPVYSLDEYVRQAESLGLLVTEGF
ncbi:MAG: hypothetical protein IJS22_02405 [Lachnospiraceae bacterium]|nr:hypothetical protein [Lachnospiraceae bacterium]